MNLNEDMLSITANNSSEIINKGFILLDNLFKEHGWKLTINKFEHIAYSKSGFETTFFDIKLDQNKIYVSVPIKNSLYQFKTYFANYFQASEYVEERFKDFIDTR